MMISGFADINEFEEAKDESLNVEMSDSGDE